MQRIQRNNPSEGRRTTGLKASWLAHSELWLGKHKRKKREDSFGSFKVQLRLLLFLCFSACYGGFRPLLDPSRARFAPLWISPPVHLFFSRTLSVSKLVKPSDFAEFASGGSVTGIVTRTPSCGHHSTGPFLLGTRALSTGLSQNLSLSEASCQPPGSTDTRRRWWPWNAASSGAMTRTTDRVSLWSRHTAGPRHLRMPTCEISHKPLLGMHELDCNRCSRSESIQPDNCGHATLSRPNTSFLWLTMPRGLLRTYVEKERRAFQ